MVAIQINEDLAAKLEALANAEGRTVEAVLETLVTRYQFKPPTERTLEEQSAAMLAIAGTFDDDVTDLSETVDESIADYVNLHS